MVPQQLTSLNGNLNHMYREFNRLSGYVANLDFEISQQMLILHNLNRRMDGIENSLHRDERMGGQLFTIVSNVSQQAQEARSVAAQALLGLEDLRSSISSFSANYRTLQAVTITEQASLLMICGSPAELTKAESGSASSSTILP